MGSRWILPVAAITVVTAGAFTIVAKSPRMGKQPDGKYVVSSGQTIEGGSIPFRGRPADIAVHPSRDLVAVLNKSDVFLISSGKVLPDSKLLLGSDAAFTGMLWLPDGKTLIASTAKGPLATFTLDGDKLIKGEPITLETPGNPLPAGMSLSPDGKKLYVALSEREAAAEVDLATRKVTRTFACQMIPFTAQTSGDGRFLVVSNWGGRPAGREDRTFQSGPKRVVVDDHGVVSTGSVSVVNLADGSVRHVPVGLHPAAIATDGGIAYVANSSSDTISVIDLASAKVTDTIEVTWGKRKIWGSMPVALQKVGDTLYAANGGDNAVCEIDLKTKKVRGFRPAGYYPISIHVRDQVAYVLNSKGNGSVANTAYGRVGNAHDFEGTVTILDLKKDLKKETEKVAANNNWNRKLEKPKLAVYNGAIKHVLYIIKENRTYDEVYGDLPQGNGDPKLCSLGEKVMPNHRKIAQQFTLFDNGYVSGTNSADGHQWATQSVCNDYLERMYVNYSRSYGDDLEDGMTISPAGGLWDAAIKAGKTLRVYGEGCDDGLSRWDGPAPKDWFEMWEDRQSGRNKFKAFTDTHVAGLRPYINSYWHYWPLTQSDQHRADIFVDEFKTFLAQGTVPNLMIMSLPSDHGEGTSPAFPTPRSMMADNDLALGRIVEAVSKSPIWKNTCIFVIEDDAQSGPDHVDGHRTVFKVISPYNKMGAVDNTFYTTVNMIKSIEMMLGIAPMNRFDFLARPIDTCFTDTPNLTPYRLVKNNTPLGEPNPGRKVALNGGKLSAEDAYWLEKTEDLDWSKMDGADPYWLNRINWYSIHKGAVPYPDRPGDAPGQIVDADD
jgi:YVTN family beta-propeller protein